MNFILDLIKSSVNTLLFCLVFSSFILFGCDSTDHYSNENPTIIDLSTIQKSVTNERIIRINKIIPLETDESCTIGTIDKILINNNRLILVDIRKTLSVFFFDLDGKFIRKISTIGTGEKEFLAIRDFIKKSNNDGYYLYDKRLHKLLEYDNELNYINEYHVPISINSLIEFHEMSFIVERSVNEFFINQCDFSFNIFNKYLKRPDYLLNYNFNIPFPLKKTGKNTLNYSPTFSNTIYEYKDKTFTKKYLLKDKKGFPDQGFFESNRGVHPGRILPKFQKENFLSFLDYYENDQLLLLKYYKGKNQIITFFDKKRTQTVSYKSTHDNIVSIILNNVLAIDLQGCFISYLYPYQLSEMDKMRLYDNFINKNSKINDQDNPLIVFFEVKL